VCRGGGPGGWAMGCRGLVLGGGGLAGFELVIPRPPDTQRLGAALFSCMSATQAASSHMHRLHGLHDYDHLLVLSQIATTSLGHRDSIELR